MYTCKLILASKSPRRQQLLSCLFNNFSILKYVEFEEPDPSPGMHARDYVGACVHAKLLQLQGGRCPAGSYVLVADTTVSIDGHILAKPTDKKDSRRMLQKLSGKEHQVYTGFYLGPLKSKVSQMPLRVSESAVRFKKLSPATLEWYVRTGEGLDKAGSYGFQGLGLQLIESVRGSYTNIMGLPLEDLRRVAECLQLK